MGVEVGMLHLDDTAQRQRHFTTVFPPLGFAHLARGRLTAFMLRRRGRALKPRRPDPVAVPPPTI